jgi:hypothetical protein
VDRNLFLRAALIAQNRTSEAVLKRIMVKVDFNEILNVSDDMFQKYGTALILLRHLHQRKPRFMKPLDRTLITQTGICLRIASFRGILYQTQEEKLIPIVANVIERWGNFTKYYRDLPSNTEFKREKNGKEIFNFKSYLDTGLIFKDAIDYFCASE